MKEIEDDEQMERYTMFLGWKYFQHYITKGNLQIQCNSCQITNGYFQRTRTIHFLNLYAGTSLMVQWLRLHAPSVGGPGSIPCQGTRIRMPQLRPMSQINM